MLMSPDCGRRPSVNWGAEVLVSRERSRTVLETERPLVVPSFIPPRILSVVVEDLFDSSSSSMSGGGVPTLVRGSADCG